MKKEIGNESIVGIDAGTVNCCVGFSHSSGEARIIPNPDGNGKTPSEIYMSADGQEVLFGDAAKNMIPVEPEQVFVGYKRELGSDQVLGQVAGRNIVAEYAVQCQAKNIVSNIREYFNDSSMKINGVITVPAYFDERQRQIMRDAFERAGCNVIQEVNEPTAAVLAYELSRKRRDCVFCVVDIGGGTGDVSLGCVEGGTVSILASEGDNLLGGIDVDNKVRDLVLKTFADEHGLRITKKSHPADFLEITEKSRRAKEQLSSRRETTLAVRVDGKTVSIKLTRAGLAKLVADFLDRIECLIRKAAEQAQLQLSDVDHVAMVGGSSRMHAIKALMSKLFGKPKILKTSVSPDFAVAEGAALLAAKLIEKSGSKVVDSEKNPITLPPVDYIDVTNMSLGVIVQGRGFPETNVCSVVLPKNTPLPASASKGFTSVNNQQRFFDIRVVQGEEGRRMEECLIVGERVIEFEPRDSKIKSLEATMEYDASGQTRVTIKDLISGTEEDITVDFSKNGRAVA